MKVPPEYRSLFDSNLRRIARLCGQSHLTIEEMEREFGPPADYPGVWAPPSSPVNWDEYYSERRAAIP